MCLTTISYDLRLMSNLVSHLLTVFPTCALSQEDNDLLLKSKVASYSLLSRSFPDLLVSKKKSCIFS